MEVPCIGYPVMAPSNPTLTFVPGPCGFQLMSDPLASKPTVPYLSSQSLSSHAEYPISLHGQAADSVSNDMDATG